MRRAHHIDVHNTLTRFSNGTLQKRHASETTRGELPAGGAPLAAPPLRPPLERDCEADDAMDGRALCCAAAMWAGSRCSCACDTKQIYLAAAAQQR